MALAPGLVRAAVQTLAVDAAAAEVLRSLRRAGLPSLLLRGPAVARALYDEDELRAYVDVDLLVSPASREQAETILRELGFELLANDAELKGHRPVHAHEWTRDGDRVSVDLHRTLSGARAAEEDVWEILAGAAEPGIVAGEPALLPGPAAVALIVTLHAAHSGARASKPLRDLARAVSRLDLSCWQQAAALVERLDAVQAFVSGLRLVTGGPALVERLGLPVSVSPEVALRAAGAPPVALGLEWWLRLPGWRRRTALLAHVLLPPSGALRSWRPLARRGGWGLTRAYLSQPFWLARCLPAALRAVREARRAAAR
ncbi:MAG: nucleotidyltransferase family protein [Gaiellaceae bacterium]